MSLNAWKKCSLGDVIEKIIGGGTPSKSNQNYWNGDIPWASVKDMKNGQFSLADTIDKITYEGVKNSATNIIAKDNIIIATRMGLGRCFINKIDCAINQDLKALIPNEKIEKKYLLWWLVSKSDFFETIGHGTTVKGVRLEQLKEISMILPPLKTQRKIADILSAYDDLIENNNRRIKILEEMAQKLYKEWFVDFKFPGHENTKFVESELGLIPDGWEVFNINDMSDSIGGGTPSTKKQEYWDDGNIPWFTPSDITKNNCLVLLDCAKKITVLGLKKSSAKMLPPYTILMTSRASVGFFGLSDKSVSTNQGFISVVPKKEYFRMYLLFNLLSRVDELRALAGGATYLEINKTTFRQMKITKPAKNILEKFNSICFENILNIQNLKKQNHNLCQTRDLLLPRLISGELSVETTNTLEDKQAYHDETQLE